MRLKLNYHNIYQGDNIVESDIRLLTIEDINKLMVKFPKSVEKLILPLMDELKIEKYCISFEDGGMIFKLLDYESTNNFGDYMKLIKEIKKSFISKLSEKHINLKLDNIIIFTQFYKLHSSRESDNDPFSPSSDIESNVGGEFSIDDILYLRVDYEFDIEILSVITSDGSEFDFEYDDDSLYKRIYRHERLIKLLENKDIDE